jgi:hypothetical protein
LGFCIQGWQVAKLSGNANNSSKAGAFYLNANNTSSNLNQNIASHLSLFLEIIFGDTKTLPLGKT